MRGGNPPFGRSGGIRHLLPSRNPHEEGYAALEEEARENARRREERNRANRGAYNHRYIQRIKETLSDLRLTDRVSNIILNEADGYAIEYMLKLNNDRGLYFNRGVRKNIREKYANRINLLSDSQLRSFLTATDSQRNDYIRAN
jgi:hypothetical protein